MNSAMIESPALHAETANRLQAWVAEARSALADNTLRAYRIDGERFGGWCREHGLDVLPAAASTVATFLRAEAAAGKAVATIRRRAATIARMHAAAGLPNPCSDELVRLALKGIARHQGTDQRQAAGLTDRDAAAIRGRMGDTLRDARDLALMLVGRDLLARASELVALRVEDVQQGADGTIVSLRRRKTATEARPYFIGQEAATALQQWLASAGITAGLAFRSITRGHRATDRALDRRDVSRILKARAAGARLGHAAGVSGHSLRVGMAQDLVSAGLDVASVMQAGGWRSERMVARYSERIAAGRGAVARFYARTGR
jgi:site-specific recombinase XerD